MLDRELLLGRWVLAEDDLETFRDEGLSGLHFTRHGELVRSTGTGGRPKAKTLLMRYRVVDGHAQGYGQLVSTEEPPSWW